MLTTKQFYYLLYLQREADVERKMEKVEQNVINLEEYRSWQNLKAEDKMPPKRKSSFPPEVFYMPSKKRKLSGPTQPKNAVQALNEYKTGW